MPSKNKVPISKLADYASSPYDFCARRGGIKNQTAVTIGLKEHRSAGKVISIPRIAITFSLVAAAYYFFWYR